MMTIGVKCSVKLRFGSEEIELPNVIEYSLGPIPIPIEYTRRLRRIPPDAGWQCEARLFGDLEEIASRGCPDEVTIETATDCGRVGRITFSSPIDLLWTYDGLSPRSPASFKLRASKRSIE